MKKEDLKVGNVVELRNGEKFIACTKIDGQYCCDMYTDYCDFSAFNHLFEFISLNDENPHSINILINYY